MAAMRAEENGPEEVLHRVFGFPAFRGQQEAVVRHVIDGGDALVLMPTGGGKSVCYQVPALCRRGLGLIISPLIALMDDQVAAMRQLGVNAGALHSELESAEISRVFSALGDRTLDLLYCSPERLLSEATLERLSREKLALIAIDEAHCVSAWGHEFRPEYRLLKRLREVFPGVPRIALTATADPRTRHDILDSLDMHDAAVFVSSFHRENLNLSALPKSREMQQLQGFLAERKGQTGIVYCGSRAKTERVTASIQAANIPAISFHAGMAPLEKRNGLNRFRSGENLVVAATIAFGMGIDRPDVRFVAHLDMPESPEAYYQQIGRAGRDGEPAETLLLYGAEDMARARRWLAQSQAPDAQREVMRQRLEHMIALAETTACRTRVLLNFFGETMEADCGHCDNCKKPARVIDGTVFAQKALSAVFRTGQIFGARHIVNVLRGETTDMITRNRHNELPLFGIGKDQPENFWRGVLRQLVARGALRVKDGEYASLELVNDTARPILRGEIALTLRDDAADAPAPKLRVRMRAKERETAPNKPRDQVSNAPPTSGEESVFEALRQWRAQAAKAQNVPPYVIFHDTVLRDIARIQPETLGALGKIKGVGASKLERYGENVLQLVRSAG
jgi:ATP-dependent DNA helicase RecQ